MSYDIGGSYFRPRETVDDAIQSNQKEQAKDKTQLRVANQEVAQDNYQNDLEQGLLRPMFQRLNSERKELKAKPRAATKEVAGEEKAHDAEPHPADRVRDSAQRYQDNNPEFRKETLAALRQYIKPGDDKEQMAKKVRDFYPDLSLQDEALDFLIEVFDGPARENLQQIKEQLNRDFGREVVAGKNMGREAREFSEKGIGSPTALRDMYRDVTGNPRDAPALFGELSAKFPYEKLKTVVQFFLKSLGADLRTKGSSIEPGQLYRLITETRVMQSILGVYRFFRLRMKLVNKEFHRHSLAVPPGLNFEEMSKAFMRMVNDRFPSDEKFRLVVAKLGVERSTIGTIILLSQMRDAIREVDGKRLYGRGSAEPMAVQNHQAELWKSIIGALEVLEDDYEAEMGDEGLSDDQGGEDLDEEIDDFPDDDLSLDFSPPSSQANNNSSKS